VLATSRRNLAIEEMESIMNKFFAFVLAAACLVPAAPAFAYEKCEGLTDSDLTKCESKEAKRIAKLRKNTVPYTPSNLGADFKAWDDEAKNPFAQDDWYCPASQSGIAKIDELLNELSKVQCTMTMAKYVGWLNANGQGADATALGKPTLDALMAVKDSQAAITEKFNAIKSTSPTELVDDPSMVLKVPGALATAATMMGALPATIGAIPGAITAVKPIAAGVGGAAVGDAMDKLP
jgi:hypothetical protein